MVKYCKNCGCELPEGSLFCDECGTKVGQSTPRHDGGNDLFNSYNIDMMDGEEVIRHSQIHIGCLYLPIIVIGIGIFFGLFLAVFFMAIMLVGLIWLLIRFIGYKANDLILTNKRVFGKCGLISTTQMQAPLSKIDSVSFNQGLVGKIIGYGTVKIATTSSIFKFRFIRDGQTLYNDIFNQVEISEREKRVENANVIVEAFSEKLD